MPIELGGASIPAAKPRLTQFAFTSPFEGIVPHMYLDGGGNVTCGIGFLIPNVTALERYPWHPSVATARADFLEVRAMERGRPSIYYRRSMCARLTDADMRQIFESKVAEFRASIAGRWSLASQPEAVQIALVDMAYTLGARGLAAYTRMLAALTARDYAAASRECTRGGVQRARNEATARLIASACAS